MKELYEWIDEADNYIENEGDITFEGVLTSVKESFEDLSSIKTEKEVQDLLANCGVESVEDYAKKLYEVIKERTVGQAGKVKDMKKYDLRTDANNNIVAMNDGFFENTAKLVSPACFNPDDYFTVEKSKAIYRISKNDYRIRKDRYDKFLAKID